jgi:hypothetical protein
MMKYFVALMVYVGMTFFSHSFFAADCPDIKKMYAIVKEVSHTLNVNLCAREINGRQLEWLKNTALPQLMNARFLGVVPPSYWPDLANEFLTNCYHQGDLCAPAVQEEFKQCIMAKLPLVLFQLGPWIDTNCTKINKAVVINWAHRKPIVMDLMAQYLKEFK